MLCSYLTYILLWFRSPELKTFPTSFQYWKFGRDGVFWTLHEWLEYVRLITRDGVVRYNAIAAARICTWQGIVGAHAHERKCLHVSKMIGSNYRLERPTVATPHKFHTSFWQVFDKFDGSHDKNFLLSSWPLPIFGRCDWLFRNQQPSNLSETCQKLVQNLCGMATVGRARL